jgi:hypothetical protein
LGPTLSATTLRQPKALAMSDGSTQSTKRIVPADDVESGSSANDGEGQLSWQEEQDEAMRELIESSLDASSTTCWVVIWANRGGGWLRTLPATMFVQICVPLWLIYDNWPADGLCPRKATIAIKLMNAVLLYVLLASLQSTRDEVSVLRYLRNVFWRKCQEDPGMHSTYLTAGIVANSVCALLVVIGTYVLNLGSPTVLGLVWNVMGLTFLVEVDNYMINLLPMPSRRRAINRILRMVEQQHDSAAHHDILRRLRGRVAINGFHPLRALLQPDLTSTTQLLVLQRAVELALLVVTPLCM